VVDGLVGRAEGCRGGQRLITRYAYSLIDWYNPAANVAKTVLGGPAGGGYVANAILFPAS
jgi:hypothetical protein